MESTFAGWAALDRSDANDDEERFPLNDRMLAERLHLQSIRLN
jgi:hypothetical protein